MIQTICEKSGQKRKLLKEIINNWCVAYGNGTGGYENNWCVTFDIQQASNCIQFMQIDYLQCIQLFNQLFTEVQDDKHKVVAETIKKSFDICHLAGTVMAIHDENHKENDPENTDEIEPGMEVGLMRYRADLFSTLWKIVELNWTIGWRFRDFPFPKMHLFRWYHLIDLIKKFGFENEINDKFKLPQHASIKQLYDSQDVKQFLFDQVGIYPIANNDYQLQHYQFSKRVIIRQLDSDFFATQLLGVLLREFPSLRFGGNYSTEITHDIQRRAIDFLKEMFCDHNHRSRHNYIFMNDFHFRVQNQFTIQLLNDSTNTTDNKYKNQNHQRVRVHLLPNSGDIFDQIFYIFDFEYLLPFETILQEYIDRARTNSKTLEEFCCIFLYITYRNVYNFDFHDDIRNQTYRSEHEANTIKVFNLLFNLYSSKTNSSLWAILRSFAYGNINNNTLYNPRALTIKKFNLNEIIDNDDMSEFDDFTNQQDKHKHNWSKVINFWKWNEQYCGSTLKNDGSYPQDETEPMFILDIAILWSTWSVIENMISLGILNHLTYVDWLFYRQNLKNLKLPPCSEIKNYQQYIEDRNTIWDELEAKLTEEIGAIGNKINLSLELDS